MTKRELIEAIKDKPDDAIIYFNGARDFDLQEITFANLAVAYPHVVLHGK